VNRWGRCLGVVGYAVLLGIAGGSAQGATEVRLDKDFLAGIAEKLPPSPFEKKGQYKGTVHSYRLLSIDPGRRRLLAACQVEGEFRPPVSGPLSDHVSRSEGHVNGLRKFRFDIKAGVNIEAGADGMPHFRVEVEEIKKGELEGFVGLLAKLLGKYFDDMVTQIADGRAALLNQKLNAEVMKRSAVFKAYGVFSGIDYGPQQIVLRFDLTRFQSEGIVGYVFLSPQPGTVPLYRWFNARMGSHEYTTSPGGPGRPALVSEGVACYVPAHAAQGVLALYGWHGRKDHLYATSAAAMSLARLGLRTSGLAFYVFENAVPGSVPFYRFFDPRQGLHFYTLHPHAEFAK
jgi:hypothetical protein